MTRGERNGIIIGLLIGAFQVWKLVLSDEPINLPRTLAFLLGSVAVCWIVGRAISIRS